VPARADIIVVLIPTVDTPLDRLLGPVAKCFTTEVARQLIKPYERDGQPYQQSQVSTLLDFVDVRRQEAVKRAITIACAGGHNILMLCQV
jgi:predicted ATPase with chaperone activity